MIEFAIAAIPPDMIPHTDDSSKYGYPFGVGHNTIVTVVINHDGHMSQHTSEAQSFGWQIAPHAAGWGCTPCAAPITHYRIEPITSKETTCQQSP